MGLAGLLGSDWAGDSPERRERRAPGEGVECGSEAAASRGSNGRTRIEHSEALDGSGLAEGSRRAQEDPSRVAAASALGRAEVVRRRDPLAWHHVALEGERRALRAGHLDLEVLRPVVAATFLAGGDVARREHEVAAFVPAAEGGRRARVQGQLELLARGSISAVALVVGCWWW